MPNSALAIAKLILATEVDERGELFKRIAAYLQADGQGCTAELFIAMGG